MKLSIVALLFVLGIAATIFYFPPSQTMNLALVGDQSGGTSARDQQMLSLIEAQLQTFADEHRVQLVISRVDTSLPFKALESQIQELVETNPPDILIGCGDSACVRKILPYSERYDLNLIYPGSSEGLFHSRYLIHLGVVANQFLFPAVSWIQKNLGSKIFYIGSESARSRMMGRMLTNQLLMAKEQNLQGEEYISGLEQLPSILDKIAIYKPDVVLIDACEWLEHPKFITALNNISHRKFSLCTDQRVPVFNDMYFVSHYFDHRRNRINTELKKKINGDVSGLLSMTLYATEVYLSAWKSNPNNTTQEVADYFRGRNAFTASGSMAIDFHNKGSWHSIFIVRSEEDGDKLLWISEVLMRPVMFPGLDAPSDWEHHLTIYWRNNRGRWHTGTVNGEPWL